MTFRVKILDHAVVGPFVRNIKCGSYRASVGILATFITENLTIKRIIEQIYGIIES